MTTLPSHYREEAEREIRAAATANIGPNPSHIDFELMLRAWHSGPAGRDVAMHMADLDRNRATRATRSV